MCWTNFNWTQASWFLDQPSSARVVQLVQEQHPAHSAHIHRISHNLQGTWKNFGHEVIEWNHTAGKLFSLLIFYHGKRVSCTTNKETGSQASQCCHDTIVMWWKATAEAAQFIIVKMRLQTCLFNWTWRHYKDQLEVTQVTACACVKRTTVLHDSTNTQRIPATR